MTAATTSRLPQSIRPLRHRNYALFWTANLVSNIGTWMETVAVGQILAVDTGRASAVGLAAAAAFLPMAIFAPIGGLIGDRVHRKRFLMATVAFDLVLAVVLTVLVASGVRNPAILSLVLFIEGCSASLSLPNRQALTPELVPAEDLHAAISLGSASWNGGRVFGPVVAGVVISLTSVSTALAINAVSFGVLLFAAYFIFIPPREAAPESVSARERVKQGIYGVRSSSTSRFAILVLVLMACTTGPFIGLIPIVAENVYGDATLNVWFITAQGIGAVLGTLLAPSIAARVGRGVVLAGGFCALPFALGVYAWAPNKWVASAALLVMGAGYFIVLTGSQTLMQMVTPQELRARTAAIFSVALGASYVPAIALAGIAGDHFGLRTVIWAQAALSLAAVVFITLRRPKWWNIEVADVGH
jgi:MFS family permease